MRDNDYDDRVDPYESERRAEDFEDVGSVLSRYKGMFIILGLIMLGYVTAFVLAAMGIISRALCNWIIIPLTAILFAVYLARRTRQ